MKSFKSLYLLLLMLVLSVPVHAQKKDKKFRLKLTSAVVVGQVDNPQDRYSLEINMTELLGSRNIKAIPSLNLLKLGGDPMLLASDSIQNLVKAKGVDTYMLVTVRGYDRKFELSSSQEDLKEALERSSLYELYKQDIVSVTFEFRFYRDGKFIYADSFKCGNVGSRDAVIKKLRLKTQERLDGKWTR